MNTMQSNDEFFFSNTEQTAKERIHRLAIVALTACFTMLAVLLAQAEAAQTRMAGLVRPNDVNSGTLLLPSKEPGFFVQAPRLNTNVEFDVNGSIIRARITQRFKNPTKGWVEGTYVFPLPDDAAVDRLKMQIGERLIEGKIKPRAEAREIFEAAKAKGQKTALLEQQRPNIFTNQVANIGPGETIIVQIEYQQTVLMTKDAFSFRFPMVVAPRYNPDPIVQTVDFGTDRGFAITNPVPDREKTEAPVLDPRENAKINPVTLTVRLSAGFPIGEVTTPYHTMNETTHADGTRIFKLKAESVPADRDFLMEWHPATGQTPSAGLFRQITDGQAYLLAFVTPPSVKLDTDQNREVIFIIDNSGSMAGASIRQAREALAMAIARLSSKDRFNIIRFDDTYDMFFEKPLPATSGNRENAIAWVSKLEAEGGTEMLPALKAALKRQGPIEKGALRQVVFLTDGAIGNENQLFDTITHERGQARVFTVGIGSAPNSFFMTRAAETGRGTFTHVGSEQEIGERIAALLLKLENPAMTDIEVSVDGVSLPGLAPNPVPDLYLGEPVVLTARIQENATGTITLTGMIGAQPWRAELPLAKAADGTGIDKLWARRTIADLEVARLSTGSDTDGIDKRIETVALDHHLVSRLTSLVAVDVTPSRPGDEPLADTKIPLNLPDGWDFEAVFGEQPAQSTPQMQKAMGAQTGNLMTMADTRMVAAAPSPQAASVMAANARKQVALPQTATLADRDILLGILLIVFAGMALMATRLLGSHFRSDEHSPERLNNA